MNQLACCDGTQLFSDYFCRLSTYFIANEDIVFIFYKNEEPFLMTRLGASVYFTNYTIIKISVNLLNVYEFSFLKLSFADICSNFTTSDFEVFSLYTQIINRLNFNMLTIMRLHNVTCQRILCDLTKLLHQTYKIHMFILKVRP